MKLVLIRHSESDWNKLNLFTGWTDVDLSPTGIPLVYEFDDNFNIIKHYYLSDEALLKAKMDAISNQGKKAAV